MTIDGIKDKKRRGAKITMLTAYDWPTARCMDEAGIDIVLVGDSLANVVLGLESTTQVGMTEMLHHAKAVSRGVEKALVVGDMPFESYQVDARKAVANGRLFIDEAGCGAVKLEWFPECPAAAAALVKSGIAVMGHVGLTPQTAAGTGGMTVRGKDAAAAQAILEQAKRVQDAGCFAVVLECIPAELARKITQQLDVPTIGIGAGPDCDGQVLVSHDVLGLPSRYHPKFTKQYAGLGALMRQAFSAYRDDVASGRFPDSAHSFHMPPDELSKLG